VVTTNKVPHKLPIATGQNLLGINKKGEKVLPTFFSASGYFQALADSFLIQSGVTESPSSWSMVSRVFPSSIITLTLHFTLPHI